MPIPFPLAAPELAALAGFAFVTSITPGPNNLMLLASGTNFGVRRTVPHLLGVAIGFTVMTALVGLGLAGAMTAHSGIQGALRVASAAYVAWLAFGIATAAPPRSGGADRPDGPRGTPMTFLQAAAFQWVNPKAWAMALGAVAAYAPSRSVESVLAVALVFGAVNLPSVAAWAVLGQSLRGLLARPRRLRAFNVAMALLLVASIVPVLR